MLDVFESMFGTPPQTIAWGHSLGGMITAGLVQQFPARFSGALPMCGVLSGTGGLLNQSLDSAFAFNTLLAGGALQVVNITNPTLNWIRRKRFSLRPRPHRKGRRESLWSRHL